MRLLKTLANGNKVFESIQDTDSGPKLVFVEQDASGMEIKTWKPSFEEVAGHAPSAKCFGR